MHFNTINGTDRQAQFTPGAIFVQNRMFHLCRPDDGIGGADGQTQRTPDTILPPNKSDFNPLSRLRGRVGGGGSGSGSGR